MEAILNDARPRARITAEIIAHSGIGGCHGPTLGKSEGVRNYRFDNRDAGELSWRFGTRILTFSIELPARSLRGCPARVPLGLVRLLQRIRGDIESHMKKEELILLPALQRHAVGGLEAPIAQMRDDHVEHGELLRRLEDMAGGFALPDDACGTWHALYSGAAKFRDGLIEHIHLENNVLFPRFQGQ